MAGWSDLTDEEREVLKGDIDKALAGVQTQQLAGTSQHLGVTIRAGFGRCEVGSM